MNERKTLGEYILKLAKNGFEVTFVYPPAASLSDGLRVEMKRGDHRESEIIEYEKFCMHLDADTVIQIHLIAMELLFYMEDNHG